jgi:hypothetical protein
MQIYMFVYVCVCVCVCENKHNGKFSFRKGVMNNRPARTHTFVHAKHIHTTHTHGYTHTHTYIQGEEKFWTVAGDNVGAMLLCDINGDGHNELLAGSDDYDIRVVNHKNEVIVESDQTDKICALCQTNGNRFAYALVNGTVGVYEYGSDGLQRKWRVKSKHKVCAIHAFDMDGDGVNEVIIG